MKRKIPLVRAGARAGLSYNPMLRLVMTGRVSGGQDERGRWYVDEESLDRFIAERAAARDHAGRTAA